MSIVEAKSKRHSFQPETSLKHKTTLRHTQSQNSNPEIKKIRTKKVSRSVEDVKLTYLDETKNVSKRQQLYSSGRSTGKRISNRPPSDEVFKTTLSRTNSTTLSIRSTTSTQSAVVKEQYCCCSQRTQCERRLLITIGILGSIIVILIIIIAVISDGELGDASKTVMSKLFPSKPLNVSSSLS